MRPSVSSTIAALRKMPRLETVNLRDTLSSHPERVISVENAIPLAYLTRIYIQSNISECTLLLSHLTYPSTVHITLDCTIASIPSGGKDFSASLRSVRAFGDILRKSQPIRSLATRHPPHPEIIQLKTYDTPDTCGLERLSLTLRFVSGSPVQEDVWADVHEMFWKSIPTEELESLHVTKYTRYEDIWPHIFDGVAKANLRRLTVSDKSGVSFLRAFSADAPPPQSWPSKQRIRLKFPTLRKLTIEGWAFNEVDGHIRCSEWLKFCLKDRRKRRSGIAELVLKGCHGITDRSVAELKKVVQDVTWN